MDNNLEYLSFNGLLKLLRLLAAYEHYDPYDTPAEVLNWWDRGVTANVVEKFILDKLS